MEHFVWIIVSIPILFFFLIIILVLHAAKKRRQAMQALALELGYSYDTDDPFLVQRYRFFRLFDRGRSPRSENVLTGTLAGVPVTVCDYQYTTGGGKNSSTHRQTICIVTCPDLELPNIFVRRELPVFDRLGKWFGGQDINFAEDPDFSKAFVLQGMDEPAVRRFFHYEIRALFLTYRQENLQFESFGDTFLLHLSRQLKPEQIRRLLDIAADFIRTFRRR